MYLCALWGFLFFIDPLAGQTRSALLTAEIANSSPPVRSGAPVTILWKLQSHSSALLEGRLELTVRDGTELLARLTTETLALPSGESFQRTVLPPLNSSVGSGSVDVGLRFVTERQSIPLDVHALRVANPWQRSFVIGLCDPWRVNLPRELDRLLEALRFESYSSLQNDRTLSTAVSRIPPEELSADPLAWCGFDVAVLAEAGFADLRDAQLQAVSRWVEAGGSLCVVPSHAPLKDYHLRFLQDLSGGDPAKEHFPLDSRGRLIPLDETSEEEVAAGSGKGVLLKRYGLGRVAIVLSDLAAVTHSDFDVRRAAGFLWKLRHDQIEQFVESGQWWLNKPQAAAGQSGLQEQQVQQLQTQLMARQYATPEERAVMWARVANLRPKDMQLAPTPIQTGDQLLERLMPLDLKIVPLKLMGLVLLLYVLAIGPGDYFLLGAIKKRKWTWVLFPATTLAVTLGTVWLSHWYMRVSDTPRRVTILDIGERGRVARVNSFVSLFQGAAGEAATDVSRAIFSAMNIQEFSQGTWQSYQQAQARGMDSQYHLVGPARIDGRVPTQFSVRQYLPQWTPQLNRTFSLAAPDDVVAFDWDGLAKSQAHREAPAPSGTAMNELLKKVRQAFGNEAQVSILSGERLTSLQSAAALTTSAQFQSPYAYQNQTLGTTFLQDICLYPGGGMFAVVSQLSPKGGDDFEDLALVDPSDPKQWLLIVAVPKGDDLVVYRKLYAGE